MNLGALQSIIMGQSTEPVPNEVSTLYASFCAELPAPSAVVGGLFYGSQLWKAPGAEALWDMVVLVDRYRSVTANPLLRLAGRVLAPNVYAHETTDENGAGLRAKIAVMRRDQFLRHCQGRVISPQTWARFAQPARLIAARDAAAKTDMLTALAEAVLQFHRATLPWVHAPVSISDFWQIGLTQTYASEFRAEAPTRLTTLVAASQHDLAARTMAVIETGQLPLTIDALGQLHVAENAAAQQRAQRHQMVRNKLSKVIHVCRLLKAAFTYRAGIDYLLQKIARHSGVTLVATPFQRRHPLLAALPLFIKGLRARAFR